jgi:GT2 family glycosyltransferase
MEPPIGGEDSRVGESREVPWPVLDVDAESGPRQDVAREPGAGAFVVYWAGGRPVGEAVIAPGESITADDLRRRARELASAAAAAPPLAFEGKVSLVIPTRDRAGDLRRCLASLAQQRRIPDEVIVVDNASATRETRDVAAAFPFVTYVREDRAGLDFARNAGVRAASGDAIAFCDDDVVLDPDWARNLCAPFADPAIAATTGLVLPYELRTQAQRLFQFHWGFGRGYAPIDFTGTDAARRPWRVGAGASMAFRRTVFETLGDFDVRLDAGAAGCSGDSEMWYRILASGGTCRYVPDAVSFHKHRETMEGLRRQLRAYMRGHVMALLVQFQRTRRPDSLKQAFVHLPLYYLRRSLRRLVRGGGDADTMLGEEIAGYFGGFAYFLRHPAERRQEQGDAPAAGQLAGPR